MLYPLITNPNEASRSFGGDIAAVSIFCTHVGASKESVAYDLSG